MNCESSYRLNDVVFVGKCQWRSNPNDRDVSGCAITHAARTSRGTFKSQKEAKDSVPIGRPTVCWDGESAQVDTKRATSMFVVQIGRRV